MPQTKEKPERQSAPIERGRHVSGVTLRALSADTSSEGLLRLLVVDDEPAIRHMLVRALSAQYRVHATDAAGALAALGDGNQFDAMLTDVSMPIVNGVMLFQAVEELSPSLAGRTIMMSGGADAVANDFITRKKISLLSKPFSLQALRAILRSICAEPANAPTSS